MHIVLYVVLCKPMLVSCLKCVFNIHTQKFAHLHEFCGIHISLYLSKCLLMQTVDIFMSDVYQHNGLAVTQSPIISISLSHSHTERERMFFFCHYYLVRMQQNALFVWENHKKILWGRMPPDPPFWVWNANVQPPLK